MKIPYSLIPAVPLEQRYAHMKSAIARGLPRLKQVEIDDSKTLHLACFGPSLRETWQQLGRPLMSMSGATRWLAERGVVPDYHVAMDPRENQAEDVDPPVPGVKYLIASVCCPKMFDVLAGEDVTLWHCVSANETTDYDWVARHDDGELIVATGSTIGLGAIQLGGILGYRHFEIHGMDGSFASDGVRHAGKHTERKPQKDDITWDAGRVTYRTSRIMANAVAETINAMRLYPIFSVFHGNGLTQALIREEGLDNACCADEPRAAFVRRAQPRFVEAPAKEVVAGMTVWEAICFADPDPNWVHELQVAYAIADGRRQLAKFDTGSISLETGLLLRALCKWKQPETIVEIGTFIGKSTVALQARRALYTCDKDNDCLPSTKTIYTHPYTTSTAMLRKLAAAGERVDLFFFDGRLTDEDAALVKALSKPRAVYAFDDTMPGGKGEANVKLLGPMLDDYAFVPPHAHFVGRSTLSLLVPVSSQGAAKCA